MMKRFWICKSAADSDIQDKLTDEPLMIKQYI